MSESNSAAILLADSQLKGGDDLFQQAEVMNGFRIFKKDLIKVELFQNLNSIGNQRWIL